MESNKPPKSLKRRRDDKEHNEDHKGSREVIDLASDSQNAVYQPKFSNNATGHSSKNALTRQSTLDDEKLARSLQNESDQALAIQLEAELNRPPVVPLNSVFDVLQQAEEETRRNRSGTVRVSTSSSLGRDYRLGSAADYDDELPTNPIARRAALCNPINRVNTSSSSSSSRPRPAPRLRQALLPPRQNMQPHGMHAAGFNLEALIDLMGLGPAIRFLVGESGMPDAFAPLPASHLPTDQRLRALMTRDLTADDYEMLLETLMDHEKSQVSGGGATEADLALLPTFSLPGLLTGQAAGSSSSSSGAKRVAGRALRGLVARGVGATPSGPTDVIELDCSPTVTTTASTSTSDHAIIYLQDSDSPGEPMAKPDRKEPFAENKCVVCMEDIAPGESLTRLPCMHVFHEVCIKSWLKMKCSCPIDNISIL